MALRLGVLFATCHLLPSLGRARDAAEADDGTALLQTSVESMSKGAADSCSCLNWMQTYKSGVVTCGEGLELTGAEPVDHELCHDFPLQPRSAFYLNANHAYCVNAEKVKSPVKKSHPGTWCYVNSSCSELNGGMQVNSKVSYKLCQSGSGESLADMSPFELWTLGNRIEADGQMMALMGYAWYGPAEGQGSLLDVEYDASKGGLVGASKKRDTFTVVYKNEVWEANGGTYGKCVKGVKGCPWSAA